MKSEKAMAKYIMRKIRRYNAKRRRKGLKDIRYKIQIGDTIHTSPIRREDIEMFLNEVEEK